MSEHSHPVQVHKRRIKYVDQKIQLRLLIALVLFELFLTALGTGFLYLEFSDILEAQLYSVHLAPDGGYQGLMERVLYVLGGVTVVNVAALLVADRFWLAYVGRLMAKLDQGIGKLQRLEFGASGIPSEEHRLLDLLRNWLNQEQQVAEDVRQRVGLLTTRLRQPSDESRKAILSELDQLLEIVRR